MVFTLELPSFMVFSGPKLGPKINTIELRVTFRTNPDIYICTLVLLDEEGYISIKNLSTIKILKTHPWIDPATFCATVIQFYHHAWEVTDTTL